MTPRLVLLPLLLLGLLPGPSRAADITIFCSQAMTPLLRQLTPQFEQLSGDHLIVTEGLSAALKQKIIDGAAFDLAILGSDAIDALDAQGLLQPGSRVDIARSGLGVAVRAGTARPDLSNAAAVRQALLAAHAIAYSAGPSGQYFLTLLPRLGIEDAVKTRLRVVASGSAAALLASGEADIAVQLSSELVGVPGTVMAGPLPPELQRSTLLAGGIGHAGSHAEAARGLIRFLLGHAPDSVLRANGLDPS